MKFFNHHSLNQEPSHQEFVEPSQQVSRSSKAMTNPAKLALCSALLGIGLVAMNKPALATDEISSCNNGGGFLLDYNCLSLSVREGSMTPGTDLIGWTDNNGSEQRWSRFLFLTDPVTTDDWYGTPEWNIARLRNQKSGLCMATDGVPGHPLTQQICDPKNPLQLWTWRQNDTHGGYGYKNPQTDLWIDLEGGSHNKGTRVIVWYDKENDISNQQWHTGKWSDGISNSKYFINDTDPYIHYTTLGVINLLWSNDSYTRRSGYDALAGSTYNWGYSPGRPAAFYDKNNDVHYTKFNNEAVYYSFNGSGISYISEKSWGYGLVDVYIDGIFKGALDANVDNPHAARNQGGRVLFSVTGLQRGAHEIALVKAGGVYMLLDGFEVYP